MYKPILDKIKEYDYITIYRHQRPDGDCMFSALALYEFLKDNFKEKQIKIAGEDTYEIITKKHKISDSFARKSLAIVVDTSSVNRIDDIRATQAPFMIKIDHHPVVEQQHIGRAVGPVADVAGHVKEPVRDRKRLTRVLIPPGAVEIKGRDPVPVEQIAAAGVKRRVAGVRQDQVVLGVAGKE